MQNQSSRSEFQLRPIEPQDAEQIHAMHQRSSTGSLYYRFMRNYTPNYRDAEQIVSTGEGLAIFHEGEKTQLIGYAYYVADKDKPFQAEFAAMVEDNYQGLGLGRYLLTQLCRYASTNGISLLKGSIHSTNNAIKHLVNTLDYPVQSSWDYGEYSIVLDLTAKKQTQKIMPERG